MRKILGLFVWNLFYKADKFTYFIITDDNLFRSASYGEQVLVFQFSSKEEMMKFANEEMSKIQRENALYTKRIKNPLTSN